jgi:hypothetical protein
MSGRDDRDAEGVLATLDAGALRGAEVERIGAWIRGSLEALVADVRSGRLSPEALGTRLTRAPLEDALEASVPNDDELAEAARILRDRPPAGRVAMILPSNVETAVVRPLVWALLAGNEVAVRVSSRCPGITRALVARLHERDQALGRALGVLSLDRGQDAGFAALGAWADALHVWGRDDTIARLRERMGRVPVAHGSGLSLAVISRRGAERLEVEALARDVARHDQRGCLSPQAVLLEEGSGNDARALAARIFDALSRLEARWPRGRIEPDEAARERRWRDTAHAVGDWVGAAATHAVSVEQGAIRDTPGLRNVAVHTMSRAAIDALLARLGSRLKSLGVVDLAAWPAGPRLGAHVVEIGAMQTPGLLAPADGAPPWTGFVEEAGPRSTP